MVSLGALTLETQCQTPGRGWSNSLLVRPTNIAIPNRRCKRSRIRPHVVTPAIDRTNGIDLLKMPVLDLDWGLRSEFVFGMGKFACWYGPLDQNSGGELGCERSLSESVRSGLCVVDQSMRHTLIRQDKARLPGSYCERNNGAQLTSKAHPQLIHTRRSRRWDVDCFRQRPAQCRVSAKVTGRTQALVISLRNGVYSRCHREVCG